MGYGIWDMGYAARKKGERDGEKIMEVGMRAKKMNGVNGEEDAGLLLTGRGCGLRGWCGCAARKGGERGMGRRRGHTGSERVGYW